MPRLTKLTITTAAFMLAISPAAIAQDDTPEMMPDNQIVDSFTSADIDADGALDRDEFVSFVVMKSDEGDTEYKSIKISGEYDNHFNTKDYNADGLLTAEELKMPKAEESEVQPESDSSGDEPG
jgi:Ca2+-binding EF-hand superfamily protein